MGQQKAPPLVSEVQTRAEADLTHRASTEGIIPHSSDWPQEQKKNFLEVKINFPSGGALDFMREPMAEGWFNAICVLVGIFIVGSGLLQFFGMIVGA